MRDLNYTTEWSDTLTFRIQYQSTRPRSTIQQTSAGPPAAQGVSGDQASADCKIMRLSPSSMMAIRSLPSTSLVLLLTPVITPKNAGKARTKSQAIDPFESFGRELSKHHRRLRHVPYVPAVGITDTHVAFIEQAAAIIVVISACDDPDEYSLGDQRSFADDVAAKRAELSDETCVPFMLVRFGPTSNYTDSCDDEYEVVLYAPAATAKACTKATQLIFKSET